MTDDLYIDMPRKSAEEYVLRWIRRHPEIEVDSVQFEELVKLRSLETQCIDRS